MYTLAKLDVTAFQGEGNWVYECEWEFSTWSELMADIARRGEYANAVFFGRGSHILQDREVLGSLADLDRIEKPYRQITRAEFLAHVEAIA